MARTVAPAPKAPVPIAPAPIEPAPIAGVPMKKLIVLCILVALGVAVAKKVRDA